jgi:hypothetical protein
MGDNYVCIMHPKGARLVQYPKTGSDPQLTTDEEIMLWQAHRIAALEYQVFCAQRSTEIWPLIPPVSCEG